MAKVNVAGNPYGGIIQKATSLLGSYTPQSMQKASQTYAQSLIGPQIADQNAQNQAQQQLLSNLYNRQTGFALAMAKLSDPNADAARNDYLQAANTMGTLGQGITGAVGQDWAAAADQAKTAAAGMTNQGSVQGLYDPSGLQSTGYTTNFALPGQGLAEMATTAAADARNRQIASANQLGVLAANTQTQQSQQAAQNAQQLRAIRAQAPAIAQQSLQNQQQLRQNAWESLANLTGQSATYQQNAAQMAQQARQFQKTQATQAYQFGQTQKQSAYQFGKQMGETKKVDAATISNNLNQLKENQRQFGVTSTEQHLTDLATIAYNKGQLEVAQKYLDQAGQQIAGKVQAQDIANRANLGQLTGYDPATGKLMAGYTLINGQPIPYKSYVDSLVGQARLAMYQSRAGSDAVKNASYMSKVAATANDAIKQAANPGGKAQYKTMGIYDSTGKKTGEKLQLVPGTGNQAPVPYQQVLDQVVAMGPQTKEWLTRAQALVRASPAYGTMGQNGVPYTGKAAVTAARQFAQQGISMGQDYQTALTVGRNSGVLPDSVLIPALKVAYGAPRKAVPAVGGAARRSSLWLNQSVSGR
jgi:hypothetical protein